MTGGMTMEAALALALRYAEEGIPAGPCAISWDERKQATNKRPLTAHGFKDFTAAADDLRRRFNGASIRPGEAWGVGLWPGPAGIAVLDVDTKNGAGGDDSLAELEREHGALPDTIRVVTASRGGHVWLFKGDRHVGNPDFAPGVEVRSDDGFVIAPGVVTPWGSWEWEHGYSPDDAAKIADAPDWVLARFNNGAASSNGSTPSSWHRLDEAARSALHPGTRHALEQLEDAGWHAPILRTAEEREPWVEITRPGKTAGTSASIGYVGPGVVAVFTGTSHEGSLHKIGNVMSTKYEWDDDAAAFLTREEAERRWVENVANTDEKRGDPADPLGWDAPVPLGRRVALPPFPIEVLPSWQADFVAQLAEAMQVPLDLPGVLVLTTTAVAAGGRAVAEVRPGWREPLNLYTAVAMPPGSRKSPVFARVTAPLTKAERDAIERARPLVVEAAMSRKVAQQAAEQAAHAASKANEGDREAAKQQAVAAAQMAEAVVVPVMPRLLADDCTPEALASLVVEHSGRIAVMSAEGDVFGAMAGRYTKSNAPNLAVYLKGHAGDALRVDRKGRPPEYVERPALTIGVTAQPSVLSTLGNQPDFRGRGLLARFLWSLPVDNVGTRTPGAKPVTDEVGDRYDTELEALVESLAEWDDPAVLVFTQAANDAVLDLERHIEPRLGPGGDLAHVREWGAKLAGATVRIAGLLHVATNVRTGWAAPVEAATVADARKIADYFVAHAVAVFDLMDADPLIADARAVLRWCEELTTFTKRECHRAHESRFSKATDLDPVLSLLEDRGWVRRMDAPEPSEKGGRPPSPTYVVHPEVQRHNRHNRHNPAPAPSSVGSVGSVDTKRSAEPEPREAPDPVALLLDAFPGSTVDDDDDR